MEVTLTQENFDAEVLKSTIPVLVDFWAVWCGPCKLQNPILEELTKELAGKVKIAKLNVDEYPDLASTYNVMSIPTLKFFNKGQVMSEMIGLQSRERLLSEIQKISQ
jgi:thioredoxin 1